MKKNLKICIHPIDLINISQHQKSVFIVLNSLVSLFIVIANTTAIFVVIKTRQVSNQSVFLTFILCIADNLFGLIEMTSVSVVIWYGERLDCMGNFVLDFLINMFLAAPTTIIVLVTFDRYLHVRYISDYVSVFTITRYRICLVLVAIVIMLQAILGSYMSLLYDGDGTKGKILLGAVGSFFMFFSCAVYTKSYWLLRTMHHEGRRLEVNAKSITQMATIYLALTVIFKGVPLTFSLAAGLLNNAITVFNMGVVNLLYNLVFSAYALLNPVIFLKINRPARRYVTGFVRMRWPTSVVTREPTETRREDIALDDR